MKRIVSLAILLIVIPSLLVMVWLIDPSTHPIPLVTSGSGVFVALGIFRALSQKPGARSNSDRSRKEIRYVTVGLTVLVGPLIAALFSVLFPKLIVPIVVSVMCAVSLLSLLIRKRSEM